MTYILTYKGVKYNLSDYVQKVAIPFNTFYNEYKKSEDFKDKYKGHKAECTYFNYSDEGIPTQPKLRVFRFDLE